MSRNSERFFFAYYLDDDDLIEHTDAHPSLWVTLDTPGSKADRFYTVAGVNANPHRRSWFENTRRLLERRIKAGDFGADCLIFEDEAKSIAQILDVDLDDAKSLLVSSFQTSRHHTPTIVDGKSLTRDRIAKARQRFIDRLLPTLGNS